MSKSPHSFFVLLLTLTCSHLSAQSDTNPTDYWAYQPLKRPTTPKVSQTQWPKNPIDNFILAKLEQNNLTPAPSADKRTLLRRACFDLTGLPPTPDQIDNFLADHSPDAYEKLLDRLLASPRYGEKWARHWLDLVRYAETNGYERDSDKPFVWRYRDYVINAFNADKPYDRFIIEQLAGDELDTVTAETITATGFYRLGLWDDEVPDPLKSKYDMLDDVVSTTSQVFLAASLGCVRCHTHKRDPIEHKEYYSFLAFFHNITDMHKTKILRDISSPTEKHAYDQQLRDKLEMEKFLQEQIDEIETLFRTAHAASDPASILPDKIDANKKNRKKSKIEQRIRNKGPELLGQQQTDRYIDLRNQLTVSKKAKILQTLTPAIAEKGAIPPPTFVLLRGNPHVKGQQVEPAFPAVFDTTVPNITPQPENAESSGRRRVLAEWIAGKKNKLTARVMVNRLWQHHFGRGIVTSSNDFGKLGTKPTHPKLLDFLASEFIDRNWSVKAMHKLIMTSAAYRMSSRPNPKALARDPGNDLFARFNLRRLTAEEIRDSILAVNSTLNNKIGGPSVFPKMPEEVLATSSRPDKVWNTSAPEEAARRSIYIKVKRSMIMPIMSNFDLADTDSSCPVRFTTTQPSQALNMLNSDFLNDQAAHFADHLRSQTQYTTDRIKLAYRLALARNPNQDEIKNNLDFLNTLQKKHNQTPNQALNNFCLMVYNLNEFIYID